MASRRQAGSINQIRKKPLVPKWKVFRAKDPMMSVFMWGVNHTVTELMHVPPPGLLFPDEFRAFSKVKIDNHFFNKENMPSHFKVKHYCPNVFRSLRQQFGVDQRQYLRSLSAFEPEADPQESSGLYVSYDRMFVIKTIDSESVAELHSILFQYHSHVVERQGKTLLPQYLGLYRITVDGTDSYQLVMRNVFGSRYTIHKKYDLKGSTVQRQASEKEKSKELPTFKDNDFLDDNYKLYIPADVKARLIEILKSDTGFLAKLHLMDYSLLVGIHDVEAGMNETVRTEREIDEGEGESGDDLGPSPPDSPIPSVATFNLDDEFFAISSSDESPKKFIYFVGLVDILTYYGVKKRTASAAKSVKYGAEAENISTVKPDQYARRLLEFVNRNVISTAKTTSA